MTPAEHFDQRQKNIQAAMADLAMDSRFTSFIAVVRDQRETAIENLTDGSVIGNERATLACIGEIACYQSIVAIYDDFRVRVAQKQAEDEARE